MAEYLERKKVYKMLHSIGGCGADPESWADGWDKAIDTAIWELEKIPAATVRPERHGHWIREYLGYGAHRYKCSVCGSRFGEDMIDDFKHDQYCSDCGAKMDGKDGEQNG